MSSSFAEKTPIWNQTNEQNGQKGQYQAINDAPSGGSSDDESLPKERKTLSSFLKRRGSKISIEEKKEKGNGNKDIPESGLNRPITLTITFENLSYWVSSPKPCGRKGPPMYLLRNITGTIKPGVMTALMGPSGAGKSTLLDILAGIKNIGVIEGQLLYNGSAGGKFLRKIVSYVEQKDILLGSLTVREILTYSALMRIPRSKGRVFIDNKVTYVIQKLGLESVANSIIGTTFKTGISGGQVKRTSIAMELLTDPVALFLDEPTSGLDSAIAYEVMSVVRELTNSQISVICTIHQPSSDIFYLFDRLCLLVNGKIVYNGLVSEATSYFASKGFPCTPGSNPADHILNVISPRRTSKSLGRVVEEGYFAKEYENSQMAAQRLQSSHIARDLALKNDEDEINENNANRVVLTKQDHMHENSFFWNYWILLKRNFNGKMRDPTFVITRLSFNTLFALFNLSIFIDSPYTGTGFTQRISILFQSCLFLTFGAAIFMQNIFNDRSFFIREQRSSTYQIAAYFFGVVSTEFPLMALGSFIYTVIIYFGIPFRLDVPSFLWFWFTVTLNGEIAASLAQFYAAFSGSLPIATILNGLTMLLCNSFSGFYIRGPDIPSYWIWAYYISYMRYSLSSLLINELDNNPNYGEEGELYLEQFGIENTSRYYMLLGQLVFWLFARTGAYLSLKYRRHDKR